MKTLKFTKTALFFLFCSVALILPVVIHKPVCGENKQSNIKEADSRFMHGVELFNEGEYSAALAEFHWAYNLQPHYAVLYNIAVCYVKLGKYVEALKYYLQYINEGKEKIPSEKLKIVNDEIKYVRSLIGAVSVKTNIDHVTILIDGKEIGKTPFPEPVPVTAGNHTIEVALSGYLPIKEEITVPTGVTIEKYYTLTKDSRTSIVKITTNAPKATVYIDKREMGKTPWSGNVPVGEHEILVTAKGYRDFLKPIIVNPEEEREINIEMEIEGKPGKLNIDSNVEGSEVWVEGKSIGLTPITSYNLPSGIYRISISKEDYSGWEGDVSIKEGVKTKLSIKMDKISGKWSPAFFSITTSITIASVVAAATLGYLTLQKQDEFNKFPENLLKAGTANMAELQKEYDKIAEEGKRLSIATDICLAASIAAGVTSVFLAFFTRFKKPESRAFISIGMLETGKTKESEMIINGLWRF